MNTNPIHQAPIQTLLCGVNPNLYPEHKIGWIWNIHSNRNEEVKWLLLDYIPGYEHWTWSLQLIRNICTNRAPFTVKPCTQLNVKHFIFAWLHTVSKCILLIRSVDSCHHNPWLCSLSPVSIAMILIFFFGCLSMSCIELGTWNNSSSIYLSLNVISITGAGLAVLWCVCISIYSEITPQPKFKIMKYELMFFFKWAWDLSTNNITVYSICCHGLRFDRRNFMATFS